MQQTQEATVGDVAVVTGAGHGMGRAHVQALCGAGFRVAAIDIDEAALNDLAAHMHQLGHEIVTLRADVTRADEVAQALALIERDCGGVDVLVNNAGGGITTAPLLSVSLADFEATLRLNLTSQFLCIRAVLGGMMARRRGRIINITSGSFFTGTTAALFREPPSNMVPYVASKGGVIGLTRALAREVGPWNIAVNAVAPGFTMTGVIADVYPPAAIERVVQAQAFARPQQADDASGAVVFLAGPGAAFITGQVIHVDGGWTTS